MRKTNALDIGERTDAIVREYDYGDERIIVVVDLGARSGETAVDRVDDSVIAIADGQQYEFDLPAESGELTANNGILTITE
jgi:hypothetical protein